MFSQTVTRNVSVDEWGRGVSRTATFPVRCGARDAGSALCAQCALGNQTAQKSTAPATGFTRRVSWSLGRLWCCDIAGACFNVPVSVSPRFAMARTG